MGDNVTDILGLSRDPTRAALLETYTTSAVLADMTADERQRVLVTLRRCVADMTAQAGSLVQYPSIEYDGAAIGESVLELMKNADSNPDSRDALRVAIIKTIGCSCVSKRPLLERLLCDGNRKTVKLFWTVRDDRKCLEWKVVHLATSERPARGLRCAGADSK